VLEQRKRYASFGKKMAIGTWLFVVSLSTVFLVMGGMKQETLTGLWFGILACFLLTFGATVLINQITNQRSLAVLEELEAMKLQLTELRKLVGERQR
jgi:Na+(H+)/acetate symporter ActP